MFAAILDLQTRFTKVDPRTGARVSAPAPNTTRTIICKAWNSIVEYPSSEYDFDIII